MPRFIPLNRNGLTARMVLQATPDVTHQRSRNVQVSDVRATPNGNMISYRARTKTIKNDDGTARRDADAYITTITVRDSQGHIHVDCECAYHPFWGAEVALSLRKAADIIRSNGRAPKVRNPDLIPLACKHATALINRLITGGKLR